MGEQDGWGEACAGCGGALMTDTYEYLLTNGIQRNIMSDMRPTSQLTPTPRRPGCGPQLAAANARLSTADHRKASRGHGGTNGPVFE